MEILLHLCTARGCYQLNVYSVLGGSSCWVSFVFRFLVTYKKISSSSITPLLLTQMPIH